MYKSNIQPLNTIDGETLMSIPVEPLNFVVDSLISQGLHILAGAPKVGKSWLALWLATTIAKGESVWNLQTKQGTTLYLCLEDSTRRIQNRLFSITDEVPSSVRFCTESNILEKGLEQQLTQFLKEYPDTVLIIIDTLQKVRGAKNDNAYANDYRDLSAQAYCGSARYCQVRNRTGLSIERTNTNLAADHVTVCCLSHFQIEVLLKTCIFLSCRGNNFYSKGGGRQ